MKELKEHYGENNLRYFSDAQGGAFVIIESITLSSTYNQSETWIGFHITHTCPYADVYPHFVRDDLSRKDSKELGEAFSKGHVYPPANAKHIPQRERRTAVQISRKSNRRDNSSNLETPQIKLLKVIEWINSR
ncbi:MAG: hypothetical protein IT344_00675 [Candidatus Dadabacteria bacterium]|nr:hypothetical protein [Candidatus Dadabacteria bacterium]